MRFPFVTRTHHEETVALYERLLVRAQSVTLSAPILPVTTLAASANGKVVTARPERDMVTALAIERAGGQGPLRQQLLTWVASERAKGTDDDTIADRITNWTDPEDEDG